MPIPDSIIDSVAIDNVKSIAGGSAFYSNLAMGNAVQHQNLTQQNALAEQAALGVARIAAVKNLVETDPTQAVALNKVLTGNDVAAQMQSLLSALNSGQQGVKSAQTTRPETGGDAAQ